MLGYDEILKGAGRDPFFGPMLGSGLNRVLPQTEMSKWSKKVEEANKAVGSASKESKVIKELILSTANTPDMEDNDKKEFIKALMKMHESNENDLKVAKEKVIEEISKKPGK
jgi:hypothetical protein